MFLKIICRYNPDEEIILEFISIFMRLFIREKLSLLVRVIKECTVMEDLKTILISLNDSFLDIDNEYKNSENNCMKLEMSEEYDTPFISFDYDQNSSNSIKFNNAHYINQRERKNSISSKIANYVNINPTDKKPYDGPKHKVPEDLQSLIIFSNPQYNIKFTYSQRMNTQMVVSGYMLKKKRGPYTASSGLRTINWKCVVDSCPYYALTLEGMLKDNELKKHNHERQPELFAKKEARFKLRQKIEEGAAAASEMPMKHFVLDTVMQETQPDMLGMIGSLDALKQAANRYKKKLIQKDGVVQSVFVDPSNEPFQLTFCNNCASGYSTKCDDIDCLSRNSENPLEIVKSESELT